jgi:bacillithiol biosynthesis cysteine-adding enzyme BshC
MFAAQRIPYSQTHAFSPIVVDYLSQDPRLKPFYHVWPSVEGIREMVQKKAAQPVDRALLVKVLQEQYRDASASKPVTDNLQKLLQPETFTVCTAHQPNLFTGPLYFIYKILHAIRLAAHLNEAMPAYHFVPVYYMGSEDADFAELNHTYVDGKKIEWKKEQGGAVGRMTVDHTLVRLIDELEGQLGVEAFGAEVIGLLRSCYQPGRTIQEATFELVNRLYGQWGLIVLIPDHPELKKLMVPVFHDDLFKGIPARLVGEHSDRLAQLYTAQAHPREINLFYLKEGIRERIIEEDGAFVVKETDLRFTPEALEEELSQHPERFSPNVILRGLFQETILPNVAFVGGGGELAYWLQLKSLFDQYGVVYPALVLRNSFLVAEDKWKRKAAALGFSLPEFFSSPQELMNQLVRRQAGESLHLNGSLERAEALFTAVEAQAAAVDATLAPHVASIRARSIKLLRELEKKMLRAEKRKYQDSESGINKIHAALFPGGGLQERRENFSYFYAEWGSTFLEQLLHHSPALEQEFTLLETLPEAERK